MTPNNLADKIALHFSNKTKGLTEKQQKVQVCENNWIRRIVGVKTVDKRRMDEMRVEVEVKRSCKKKLDRRTR